MNQVKKTQKNTHYKLNYDVIVYCRNKPQHFNNINGVLLSEFRQNNYVRPLNGKIWSIIISPIWSTAPGGLVGEAVMPRRLGSKGLKGEGKAFNCYE